VKKPLLTGIFVFSLAMNAATVATLGWHLWAEKRSVSAAATTESPLAREDVKNIYHLWPDSARVGMRELKGKIREKRAEVLNAIAANPNNPQAVEKSVGELMALREHMERQALAGIGAVMANLPQHKRDAFLDFLKSRTRMGPGMGLGQGRHLRGRHHRGVPPCETVEPPASSGDGSSRALHSGE